MARIHIIIPAAGSGSRMANVLPKQYLPLAGKPMISHSVQTFFACARVDSIYLALSPEDEFWNTLDLDPASKLKLSYTGGATRAETVLNTLLAMNVDSQDWVLVHDAARPGLSAVLLDKLLDALLEDEVGGLLAIPLADTLKKSSVDNRIEKTVPREQLWQAQTPQMFRYSTLKSALESFNGAPTDEAEAVEALGLKPKLIQGELRNMKVTYPEDIATVEVLMRGASV